MGTTLSMEFDFSTMPWSDSYKILSGSVVPRPIGWISSLGPTGVPNLAPYSFFNVVCASPPLVAFAPMRLEGGAKKDSLANVEREREFVANIVVRSVLREMDGTSAELPEAVDEFAEVGLTAAPSVVVKAPRVAESPIHFECVLDQVVHFGDGGEGAGELVIGRVVHAHVDPSVMTDGKVDQAKLQAVARMGGPFYAVPELIEFRRLPRENQR